MKLYAESQVKRMMQLARETYASEGQILLSFEPIELPTDEEVKNYYGKVYDFGDWEGFKRGTKWMRDKIQGGNK